MKNSMQKNGGVLIRVLIAGATLLLIAFSIVFVLKSFRDKEEINVRKAMGISEYGLFMAMQKLGEEPSWTDGFDKTEYEQGWYTVKLIPQNVGDTLLLSVVSVGHMGSISNERVIHLKAKITDSDTMWSYRED